MFKYLVQLKRRLSIILCLALFSTHFIAAAKVLDEKKMIDIIYDLELIRALAYRNDLSLDKQELIFAQNKMLLMMKFEIEDSDLNESLQYYYANFAKFLKIYNAVVKKFGEDSVE